MVSLQELFGKNSIRDHYLMGYCVDNKHKADSVRKYLGSLSSFLTYLLVDEIEDINIGAEDIFKLKLIPSWMSLYRSTAGMEGWQRELLELQMLVEPEQMHMYEESESAVKAKSLFKHFGEGNAREVSRAEYVAMRDHLFVCIHFCNAHRSGVSANL